LEKRGVINTHNYTCDSIKAVACIFVILIHSKFPGTMGDICEALARFGVPMFFAIAGTYLLRERKSPEMDFVKSLDKEIDGDSNYHSESVQNASQMDVANIRKDMSRKLKKTGIITAKIWILYTVYSFIYAMTVNFGVAEWFKEKFNTFEFSRLILFNSGKFIYDFTYAFDHMWYLFALIYVYGLCLIFAPILRKSAKFISVVLMMFLFFGEWLQLFYPIRPFGISVSVWYTIRNWLFVGIPFTMLGFWFKESGIAVKLKNAKMVGICLAVAGVISILVEFNIFGNVEVYFGSLLTVIGLLLIMGSDAGKQTRFSDFGDKLSSGIYYMHVLVISLFGWIIDRTIPDAYASAAFMYLRPVIIIILTILITYFMNKVKFVTSKSR
jgi:hypothetical protein